MSDVLFVVPVFEVNISNECNGTLILATILREKGIDVDIYRYYQSGEKTVFCDFAEKSAKNILAASPKIVSFYCRGDCYLLNIRVAEKLKELRPDIYIVFGGPQADISAKETLSRIPWVNYCCSGEGETTVYPLFSGLLNDKDVSQIRGLTYRSPDGEITANPRPELIENLDDNPFVDYSFIPEETKRRVKEQNLIVNIDIGRGCPYKCAYCSTSRFWQRKFRIKSPDRIAQEMIRIENAFGSGRYVLDHDLFTVNKNNVYEFCRIMKEGGYGLRWGCSSRADTIDKEVIEEMVSAGMRAMFLGIETGSPRMQKLSNKNLDLNKAFEIVSFLKEKGVSVTASFIYGFPEETEDDVEMSLQFAYRMYELGVVLIQFHLCAIFPGTEYYNKYKDQLVFSANVPDAVDDFGVLENIDFIKANEDLFPFYYEYRSDSRDKFKGLNFTVGLLMNVYKKLLKLDPDKFSGKRLTDMFFELKAANKAFFENCSDGKCKEKEFELITNYLSTVYSKEELEKLKDIFGFYNDLRIAESKNADYADVKVYNIDIGAVDKGKKLTEIDYAPTMVYINKTGKKVSYVIKPFTAN